jgi:mannose-1-phosphate guanylyltransferase
MEHIYAIIMAGGGGTRLWPISRRKHPKHLLPLLGNSTLFQSTLQRLIDFIPPDHVYVVTTAEQERELKSQAPHLSDTNFLIEPMPRGTASVVGLAAVVLAKHDPHATMIVLPADHFIRNLDLFYRMLRVAIQAASSAYLVTLGINPTFPATGYGYIQKSTDILGNYELPVYRVMQFTEKPDEAKATLMVKDGNYSWNSGMFIWRVDRILEEISHQMPELKIALDQIGASWGTSKQENVLTSVWSDLRVETIDYGIMEHADNVVVLPVGDLEWSDVGSWDSIFDVLSADRDGNVAVNADFISIETKNSLVFSSGKKLIATIGLEDLIIVDSGDALLVCHRDQSQRVRQVIEKLRDENGNHLL